MIYVFILLYLTIAIAMMVRGMKNEKDGKFPHTVFSVEAVYTGIFLAALFWPIAILIALADMAGRKR